jgi:hypothetical protein
MSEALKITEKEAERFVGEVAVARSLNWVESYSEFHVQYNELPVFILLDNKTKGIAAFEEIKTIINPYLSKYPQTGFPMSFYLIEEVGIRLFGRLEGFELAQAVTPSPFVNYSDLVKPFHTFSFFKTVRDLAKGGG